MSGYCALCAMYKPCHHDAERDEERRRSFGPPDPRGFSWGPMTVTRAAKLPKHYVLTIRTDVGREIEVYVSSGGHRIRVIDKRGEWKPEVVQQVTERFGTAPQVVADIGTQPAKPWDEHCPDCGAQTGTRCRTGCEVG